MWAQWRLSRPGTVYGRACQLAVRQWLPQVPGIPVATIAASARRIPAGPAPSEAAYMREEFGQVKAAAARTFGTALVRIRAGREQLLRWQAGEFPRPRLREQYRQAQPETAGYLTGEALDILQRAAAGGWRRGSRSWRSPDLTRAYRLSLLSSNDKEREGWLCRAPRRPGAWPREKWM